MAYKATTTICLMWILVGLAPQARSQTPSIPGWLSNRNFILPGDLPALLALAHENSGGRLTSGDNATVNLMGMITDPKGSRVAQITIQAPGYMAYRDGQGQSVVFNENGFQGKSGPPGSDDDPIMESLLAHFPDALYLQVATGGTYRRVGSHFRDGSAGPYVTLLAFSPKSRPGLAKGRALQQELFIAIDEATGLISEVRTAVNLGSQHQQVTQTQFLNWTQQSGQWLPGTITRLENGKQTLAFQVQGASVGPALATTTFVP
jgi:hypothetical protein